MSNAATRGLSLRARDEQQRAVGTVGFDWLVAICSLWLIGGVYLDGWAHINLGQLESFFTPWHAVLYSGFVAVAAALIGATFRRRSRGYAGIRAIPTGYEQSVLGIVLFAAGGAADLLWHTIFGIEVDLEALLSPTHLLLAVGGTMIVSGPFRAAWLDTREPEGSFRGYVPILLSMTLVLAVLAFMSQYVHPFGTTWAAGTQTPEAFLGPVGQPEVAGYSVARYFTFFQQLATIAGVILQTAIFTGLVLTALRRWRLPFGSLTVVLTLSTAMITLMRGRFIATGPLPMIAVAMLAGITADLLSTYLRPAPDRPRSMRWFAFAAPALMYALYFTALAITVGTWWSVHLWAGAIVLSGLVGLLTSFLIVPFPNSHTIHIPTR
jgi:hypothetical protein